MVPAAHRRLVVSAAFALVSWALAAGAPAFAAAPAEQAGPSLINCDTGHGTFFRRKKCTSYEKPYVYSRV